MGYGVVPTYDRCECTSKNQIYPLIGDKVVSSITSADLKEMLNYWVNQGYAYTTVKKVYILLSEYFKFLTQQEYIAKNPMSSVSIIRKNNFMAVQEKENLPENETITVFTPKEIELFKQEAFRCWGNGKRIYQQTVAYILMLNTGMRTGELLGLLNGDIELDNRVIHLQRGVKEIQKRDGIEAGSGREVKIGKLKTASSKRDVPR